MNTIIKSIFSIGLCLVAMQSQAGHPKMMADGSMQMVMTDEMQHGSQAIPKDVAIPRIGVEVFEDSMSGFNLHITTQNYQLEPPEFSADKPKVGVQGHAHLYVNEKKIGRIYGPYIHLPNKLLKPGLNMVSVSLNGHNHSTWTADDKEIIATIIINTKLAKPIQSVYSPYPLKP